MEFLDSEIGNSAREPLPNEVRTILGIISHISNENHPNVGLGDEGIVDPEFKIYKRFADHADFLTERFTDLKIEYGAVLEAVQTSADFGQVKLRRAARYLRQFSDKMLTEAEGNPRKALNAIVQQLANLLGQQGYTFDEGAAEFYIVDQIIKCNAFPNRMNESG